MSELLFVDRMPVASGGSDDARSLLIDAKIGLMRGFPFIGYLVMSTEFIFTDDPSIKTMAATTIGGNKVFINEPFFIHGLKNVAQRSFGVAHEIIHIFLDHIARGNEGMYHPELWGIAIDYCDNGLLKETDTPHVEVPNWVYYDARFSGMSADEIYHILLEENGNSPQKAVQAEGGGDGEEDGGQGGSGQQRQSGGGSRVFDYHSREKVSDQTRIENRQRVAASINETENMTSHGKAAGTGATNLLRFFQALLDVRIPWEVVLADFCVESARQYYTYNRISHRSTKTIIFPHLTGNHLHFVFGGDTSGSMGDRDLNELMTELYGICEEFDSWEMTLLSGDTQAHCIGEYSSEAGDDFTTIDKGLIGGGGTDMSIFVDYVNNMDDPPNVLIILTDGHIPVVQGIESGGVPVIVVVTSKGASDIEGQVPGGEVIYMKDH